VKVAGRVILTLSVSSKTGQDTFILCLGEFGKIGDSEEELADPIQQGEAIAFLFRHLSFLLLFPFYNPDTINLHVLTVLSIGSIVNAMLLPEILFFRFLLSYSTFQPAIRNISCFLL
jgi:hypothetical protein